MSGVDVLAVMDREIEEARKRIPFIPPEGPMDTDQQTAYEEAGSSFVDLREVRAAVAELIEVDLEYDEVLSKWSGERYEPDDYGVYGSDFYRCLCCENESGAGVLNRGVQHEADCVVAAIEAVETRRDAALSRVRGAE